PPCSPLFPYTTLFRSEGAVVSLHSDHRLLFGTVFLGFLALSAIIAVGPAIWVEDNTQALPASRPLTDHERQGLKVYAGEGCVACHTPQARPIAEDAVWGRPSVPGGSAHGAALSGLPPDATAPPSSTRPGPDPA